MAEIIKILEITGTIAFAISGALVAIGSSLDIFGVVFLGCITAVGGGILRDTILGIHPPLVFENSIMCVIAAVVSIAVFIISMKLKDKFYSVKSKIEHINNFFDAIGLAAFTVTGTGIGYINGFHDNCFVIMITGMITGVGGGIIRDILSGNTPSVLKKHIYAIASLAGSILYYLLRKYHADEYTSSVTSMLLVFAIRMLATHYRWSLPKIKFD